MRFNATREERIRRDEVMERVLRFIREDLKIKLPPFDPSVAQGSAEFALLAIEPNDFSGTVGDFKYQLEGEDDLLHIAAMRQDLTPIAVADGRAIVEFLLPDVAPGLIWLRPGIYSQHFYVGHDELLNTTPN